MQLRVGWPIATRAPTCPSQAFAAAAWRLASSSRTRRFWRMQAGERRTAREAGDATGEGDASNRGDAAGQTRYGRGDAANHHDAAGKAGTG